MDPSAAVAAAVSTYHDTSDYGVLLERLLAIADVTEPDALAAAAEPYLAIPEVSGPLYERIVAARPNDSRALVILANSYWLTGRGPEATGELAARALAADPLNRGAWHLWALTEGVPRERMMRWKQVVERFPEDDLAREPRRQRDGTGIGGARSGGATARDSKLRGAAAQGDGSDAARRGGAGPGDAAELDAVAD